MTSAILQRKIQYQIPKANKKTDYTFMLGFQIKFKVWPPASLACDIKENKKRKKKYKLHIPKMFIEKLNQLSHSQAP